MGERQAAGSSPVDLAIVGTGPVAASLVRQIGELRPRTSIVMVDLGPALSDPPGTHITRLPLDRHAQLLAGSQGPQRGERREAPELYAAAARGVSPTAPPGLYRHFDAGSGLPAAVSTSVVGGMGSYWGGITPRPSAGERIPFFSDETWESLIRTAEDVLGVSHDALAGNVIGPRIRTRLSEAFKPILRSADSASVESLAARRSETGQFTVVGPAQILAPARARLEAGGGSLEVRPDTLCKRLLVDGGRVRGLVLEHRPSRASEELAARAVVVAADVFRTPQLLWASDIRPAALGRYLMDHPLCNATIELDPTLTDGAAAIDGHRADRSVSCIPFADPQHPFHGVVLQGLVNLVPGSWVRTADRGGVPATVAGLTWLARTSPRPENRIVFSDTGSDWCGMPLMSADFSLTAEEEGERQTALEHVRRAAGALGTYIPGREPAMRALGGSTHVSGTTRLGASDDGTSVCDVHSRVWGFDNLILAGNGLIPVPTTVNPTLTSVALAVHAADALAAQLA